MIAVPAADIETVIADVEAQVAWREGVAVVEQAVVPAAPGADSGAAAL